MRILSSRFTVALLFLGLFPAFSQAQELDPGAYWALPNRLNIVTGVASVSFGDVNFDQSLPVEDASARIGHGIFVFTRGLGIAGRSANLAIQVPMMKGHLEGLLNGVRDEVDRFGLADPRVRLAINL